MKLSELIQKKGIQQVATATPATVATHGQGSGSTVAKVATVAVANPLEPKTEPLTVMNDVIEDAAEFFDERAAIFEYDGGLIREDAESEAWRRTLPKFRLKDANGELMKAVCVDMPRSGETMPQFLERLRAEFGERLIIVEDKL